VRLGSAVTPWALAAVVVASVVTRAQSPLPRPYRGLFGGDAEGGARKEELDLTVQGFGGYESNVALAESSLFGTPPPVAVPSENGAPQAGSAMLGASATMSYAKRWQRASFDAFGSATSTDYRAVATGTQMGYSGGVGLDVPLSRRMDLVASQIVRWSPYFELGGVFPTLPSLGNSNVPVTTPNFDLGLVPANALRSLTQIRVTRGLSRESKVEGFFMRSATHFSDATFTTFDTSDTRAGVMYSRNLSRYMTMRLGYDYRVGQLGDRAEQQYHSHEVNAGVDYHREFSLWHRAALNFMTGSTIFANQPLQVLRPPPMGSVTSPALKTASLLGPDTGRTDIRVILTGSGSLVWEFLRSWSARAMITRGITYLEGFSAPGVTNAVSMDVGGLITRRIHAGAAAMYSAGSIGTSTGNDNGFGSWNAFASTDYAMTRHFALYADYYYYTYSFERGVVLPPGLRDNFQRHGVRFGARVWMPLCCR
jgi:hypothetical protein